jgi:hypothetical protein
VELLERSSDVDVIVVVVSLSSEARIPVKRDEIKPLIDRQIKPILFFTYTLPSQFARTELAASGSWHFRALRHSAGPSAALSAEAASCL